MCIEILVGFDCLLCTGELLQLKIADSMINDQLTFTTKGDKCTGITDSVNVTSHKQAARQFHHRATSSSGLIDSCPTDILSTTFFENLIA